MVLGQQMVPGKLDIHMPKKKKKKNDVGLLPNTTQKKFTQKGPKI